MKYKLGKPLSSVFKVEIKYAFWYRLDFPVGVALSTVTIGVTLGLATSLKHSLWRALDDCIHTW